MSVSNVTLGQRRIDNVPRGIASVSARFVDRASNAEFWDVEGNQVIDFAAGIAVLNTGHRHPQMIDAVKAQLERFTHVCFHVAPYQAYVDLAERLNAAVPTGRKNKTMLVTSGAEAVENAIKIARVATGRSAVIAFSGAFHGRTSLGMALTGKVSPYKTGFGPFPPEIFHAPFPDDYRGGGSEASLAAIETLFRADVDPQRVAAIIIEPVQGEGGFNVAPPEFLRALRALCDRHGILLIADEVQTGFGRTGKMFAVEHSGVKPDLVTMAKSLAGGLPLSAITGAADIMDAVPPGGLGGTYAGNPLSCVASLAVMDIIEDEGLCERANEIGIYLRSRLAPLAEREHRACIGDVRGAGAMVAIELVQDRATRAPDAELARATIAECVDRGLIVLSCGSHGNVIRFLMPLTIDDATLKEGIDRFEQALAAARISVAAMRAADPA